MESGGGPDRPGRLQPGGGEQGGRRSGRARCGAVGVLERESTPNAYVGYEASAYVHMGSRVSMTEKIKDLGAATFAFTSHHAKLHAMINNKLGGDIEAIRTCAKYFEDAFRALGVPDSVGFAFADDLVAGSPYWADVIRVSKAASVARIKRALTIRGRREGGAELAASMLVDP